MKLPFFFGALLVGAALLSSSPAEARHHSRTSFSINFVQPQPVYYNPVPVYNYYSCQPQVTYVQPAVIYHQTNYYAPRARPIFAPAPSVTYSWYY